MTETEQAPALTAALRTSDISFDGELIFPGEPGYEAARRVWNAVIDKRPAVIARCTGTGDVVTMLQLARRHRLPVAVRGGGHSFAGHSTCDDGVVIDLGTMTQATVDPQRRIAVVEPGLTWGDLVRQTQPHGLAPVGGHVSVVGVPGLTLGGGIGWLARRHGLACDNLVEVELVTADGSVLRVSADEHPDLFWGLRGGGGNFGIVTRFTLRLHPVGTVFAGMVMHPAERATDVLRFYRDFSAAAPDDVNVLAGFGTAPPEEFVPPELRGRPAVFLAACHLGPVADGETALAPVREFGPPPVDLFGPMPFGQLQQMFDAMSAASTPFHVRAALLGPLDDAAVDTLVAHGTATPTPASSVLVIPLGGAVSEVPPDDTAFWHREARYNLEICAAWQSPDDDQRPYRSWAKGFLDAIRPWSVGVEVNHLSDDGPGRIREAYGDRSYARLAELKRRYDPDNVFRLNHNIPPAR